MNEKDQITGKKLNEEWRVGAKHALYHKDGNWYHQLNQFPGALFDPNGYVIFENEDDFKNSVHVKIEQDVHVEPGISSMPNYVKVLS